MQLQPCSLPVLSAADGRIGGKKAVSLFIYFILVFCAFANESLESILTELLSCSWNLLKAPSSPILVL